MLQQLYDVFLRIDRPLAVKWYVTRHTVLQVVYRQYSRGGDTDGRAVSPVSSIISAIVLEVGFLGGRLRQNSLDGKEVLDRAIKRWFVMSDADFYCVY